MAVTTTLTLRLRRALLHARKRAILAKAEHWKALSRRWAAERAREFAFEIMEKDRREQSIGLGLWSRDEP
jgi:hypothetical protein